MATRRPTLFAFLALSLAALVAACGETNTSEQSLDTETSEVSPDASPRTESEVSDQIPTETTDLGEAQEDSDEALPDIEDIGPSTEEDAIEDVDQEVSGDVGDHGDSEEASDADVFGISDSVADVLEETEVSEENDVESGDDTEVDAIEATDTEDSDASEGDVATLECLVDADCEAPGTCTSVSCEVATGTCVLAMKANGTPCEDGTACSEADTCQEGICVGGVALLCDDQNACTDDLCDPQSGCVYSFNLGACDDGDPCTATDLCIAGVCEGQGASCDDQNPCTVDLCTPSTGECINTPDNTQTCSDGSECTGGDHCQSGTCVPGEIDACNDGNDCTADSCDEGLCKNFPLEDEPCEDGEICTVGDLCILAACVPGQLDPCDDANPCTIDSCDMGVGCSHQITPGANCDEGDACIEGGQCDDEGVCQISASIDCDDQNPCTIDSCHPVNGCVYALKAGPCDDENPCTTNDFCIAGECSGTAATCNDDDACTHDSCDDALGCQFVSIAESCVDDDLCTDDSCDPVEGCVFALNSAPCDDALLCTEGDLCVEGTCTGQPVDCDDDDPCTLETCDPEEGCVTVPAPGELCDDGDACTEGTTCDSEGLCGGGSPVAMDDEVPCTLDACDPITGVSHTPDDGTCALGRACDPIAGCTLSSALLMITKVAWTEAEGLMWVALFNGSEGPINLAGVSLRDDSGLTHPLVDVSGDDQAPIILDGGKTVAALRRPATLPDPSTEGFSLLFGQGDDALESLIPNGGTLEVIDEQGTLVDSLDFTDLTLNGPVPHDHFPVVDGVATELDQTTTAVANESSANDPAGLWCVWPDGAANPEGPQLSCARARLNEIALAGDEGARWIEVHAPAGGSLAGLIVRITNAEGEQLIQLETLEGRSPMSQLVLLQDGVDDLTLPQLTDGSIQLSRAGELIDVVGFGTLSESVDAAFNLPILEGTAAPALTPESALIRQADGVDSDDNASDWELVAGGSPGQPNAP